jgi:hypothetical protein
MSNPGAEWEVYTGAFATQVSQVFNGNPIFLDGRERISRAAHPLGIGQVGAKDIAPPPMISWVRFFWTDVNSSACSYYPENLQSTWCDQYQSVDLESVKPRVMTNKGSVLPQWKLIVNYESIQRRWKGTEMPLCSFDSFFRRRVSAEPLDREGILAWWRGTEEA